MLDLPDAPAADDVKVPTIVRRQDGRPCTKDGLDTLFDRLKRKLVKDGQDPRGRHLPRSVQERGEEGGRPYTIEVREKGARRVFKALEKRR